MGTLSLAEGADLGTTFSTIIGDLSSQFVGAVPTVAGVAGGIIVVMIGVPLVVKLFRRLVG